VTTLSCNQYPAVPLTRSRLDIRPFKYRHSLRDTRTNQEAGLCRADTDCKWIALRNIARSQNYNGIQFL